MLWTIDNKFLRIVLSLVSGILLNLSFPTLNLEFIAWFAFLPLFFALQKAVAKERFFLSYICGIAFFGITISWLRYVSIPGYVLLVLILSLFFGIFGLYFSVFKIPSVSAIFVAPALWAFLEYVQGNLFTGFGWSLLGYSQYLTLPVIQISDITGVYGVSFLIIMINVIIFGFFTKGFKKGLFVGIIGFLILAMVLVYGYFRLKTVGTYKGRLDISVIQGNIPQHKKWDPAYKEYVLGRYLYLTKSAGSEKPYLIIWPETAIPAFAEERPVIERVEKLAKDLGVYILAGVPSFDKKTDALFNSAVLISKKGKLLQVYNKLHLVPFGEYVPFSKYLGFLRKVIDKPIGDFSSGKEYTLFRLENGLRFGVLICFEDIFPALTRRFVVRGADFLVNITNDAWFMKSAAPYQHSQSSVFRAVENRMPVVRAANTGLSCFIDERGRIIDTVKINGEEIFISGYKTKRIGISKHRSFYSDYGDLFIVLCLAILFIERSIRQFKVSV